MGSTSRKEPPLPTVVPLLDVNRGYIPLRDELLSAITRVCDSGQFVLGPEVQELEQNVARYCGVEHAIACASGSDALLLALMAHGVGRGDQVVVPSFTFFATASAAWRLGATPVFVDIDPETMNLSPAAVEAAIAPSTKAIIPVHLFGQCAEMAPILETARWHGIAVVEDAAQAIGAQYRGQFAGAIGDIGCLSFYPTKNLGGFGDGGMLTTRSAELASRLNLLRGHGMRPRYFHREVGINSRLDSVQAAALNVKLRYLDAWTQQRRVNARRYQELFLAAKLDSELCIPAEAPDRRHVWNQFTIRVPNGARNRLREHLTQAGVGSEIYYPLPLHLQDCFRGLGYREGSLPETERAAAEVLSLPIFPELTPQEQEAVVTAIARFYGRKFKGKAA
jgi:dTDP-4-amino-4,6-dideoxygalactose transaminase